MASKSMEKQLAVQRGEQESGTSKSGRWACWSAAGYGGEVDFVDAESPEDAARRMMLRLHGGGDVEEAEICVRVSGVTRQFMCDNHGGAREVKTPAHTVSDRFTS